VTSVVKTIPKVYTSVSVLVVVCLEGRQHPQLYSGSVSVLLDRPDDLDGNQLIPLPVLGLHHLAKGALAKEFRYLIWIQR
jgi:hypothetical protein